MYVKVLQRYYSHHDGCCVNVETLRFWVGTWNINGGKQFRSIAHKHRGEAIEDWLLDMARLTIERHPDPSEVCHMPALLNENGPPSKSRGIERGYDVYVVGFEEMVDLNASNIFNTSLVNQREWGANLHKLLNRSNLTRFAAAKQQQGATPSDLSLSSSKSSSLPTKRSGESASASADSADADVEEFVLIVTEQLVGICLFIFVRSTLVPYIRDVLVDQVKTGLMGAAGNKGKLFAVYSRVLECTVNKHNTE